MDMEVVYAINEVVSKLNELRSDMKELIGTVRQQNQPHPQFQQAQPFQPQMVFGQPYGYNGTPPLSKSISPMVVFNSRHGIIKGSTDEEITTGLRIAKEELKKMLVVILTIEVDIPCKQVSIFMEYQTLNKVPNLDIMMERLAHYIYTTLSGTDSDISVRYNRPPIQQQAAAYV